MKLFLKLKMLSREEFTPLLVFGVKNIQNRKIYLFSYCTYLCEEDGIDMGNLYIEIFMTVSSNQKPQNNTKSITNL